MTTETDNLYLWGQVEGTDPKYAKPVKYGAHHFTAIDAYYQIKTATEMWGPYGIDWGLIDTVYHPVPNTPVSYTHLTLPTSDLV